MRAAPGTPGRRVINLAVANVGHLGSVTQTNSTDSAARIEALARQLRQVMGALRPEAWRDVDLTISQFKALVFLRAQEPMSLGALADALGIRQASASALVERLVRLDLVSREEDPNDRRQVQLTLARGGREFLERFEERRSARLRRALKSLDPDSLLHLEKALSTLAAALARTDPGDD